MTQTDTEEFQKELQALLDKYNLQMSLNLNFVEKKPEAGELTNFKV